MTGSDKQRACEKRIPEEDFLPGMTLAAVARAVDGKVCVLTEGKVTEADETITSREITGGEIDSRKITAGALFFAVGGERTDGHKYIPQVYEKGAACVITEKSPDQLAEAYGMELSGWGAFIQVEKSLEALKKVATLYRSMLTIPFVGITGSVGKTSTKEYVAGVLAQKYKTLKTEGNFNNEIGLPLTILKIKKAHELAVVEMGINSFGEMSRLGAIARPDAVVITNIGECHLENLGDRDGVFRAKTEVFDYLQPEGSVCLNGDDDHLSPVGAVHGKPVHYFGLHRETCPVIGVTPSKTEVYADGIESLGLLGSRAVLHMPEGDYPIEVHMPGRHMVINAACAATVGRLFGLTPEQITAGIDSVESGRGRGHVVRLSDRIVIDDCYNASPVTVKGAIDLLMTGNGRKVAVLGDMFELGTDSDRMHREVGAYAVEKGVNVLICSGKNSRLMADAAREADTNGKTEVIYFETPEELIARVQELVAPGDVILVKASHSMEYERVLKVLGAEY